MRSPNERGGTGCTVWRGGASSCGIAGASILGGGGGGGKGGLNGDPPGGMICAEAALPKISAAVTVQIMIDSCFTGDML